MTRMIRCQEFLTFLDRYLSGELSAAEKLEFEHHLSVCPSCVNYLHNYRAAMQLVREACAGQDEIPGDVPEDLVRAVLKAREGNAS